MSHAGQRQAEQTGFRLSPDAVLVLAERIILEASDRVYEVFGWSPAELRGQSIRLLYPGPTDFRLIGERARRAMRSNPIYSDERFMQRKSGERVWMEAHGHAADPSNPEGLAVWTYRPVRVAVAERELGLTLAEKRVASYLVNGFTSKEIAQSIGCSPRTVEAHRSNMLRKLEVRNSFDLVSRLLGS